MVIRYSKHTKEYHPEGGVMRRHYRKLYKSAISRRASLVVVGIIVGASLVFCHNNGSTHPPTLTPTTPTFTPTPIPAITALDKTFEQYKSAIRAKEGDKALQLISQETIDDYTRIVELAITANRETIMAQSATKKLIILTLRHTIPAEQLKRMDGAAAIKYSLEKGLIAVDSPLLPPLIEDSIKYDENSATAALSIGGEQVEYHFEKENGNWKINFVPSFSIADSAFGELAASSGASVDDLILSMIGDASNRDVTDSIWDPLD